MWLATVGLSFTIVVMFTGRGGRFGSTPGLFVGMGFWRTENSNISDCAIGYTN
jgi:hypothetical protein